MSLGATQADAAAEKAHQKARQENRIPSQVLPAHTPGRLRWLAAVNVAAVAILLLVCWIFFTQAENSVGLIGEEEGPRATSSAELYHALAEMDNQVAAVVLTDSAGSRGEDTPPGIAEGAEGAEQDDAAEEEREAARAQALEIYQERRADANRAVLATSSLTSGNVEAEATMAEILDGIGRYEQLAGEVLLLSAEANGQDEPVDAEVVDRYAEATDHMREEVLPKTYNLSLESTAIIRVASDDSASTLLRGQVLVVAAGVVALAALVSLQMYIRVRFRRRINPPLLAASVVVLVVAVGTWNALGVVSGDMRTATDDGLDSEVQLAQARAIGTAATGDQTRYLIDSERADTFEQTYLESSQTVLYLPGDSVTASAEAAEAAVGEYLGESHDEALFAEIHEEQPDGMLGLLGEHANSGDLTADQRQGIENVLSAYLDLRQADLEMRDADTFPEAAAVRLDDGADGVAGTHADYEAALTELIAMHNDTFQTSVGHARSQLDSWTWVPPLGALLAIGLIVAGVRPRIAEYTQKYTHNRRGTERDGGNNVRNAIQS